MSLYALVGFILIMNYQCMFMDIVHGFVRRNNILIYIYIYILWPKNVGVIRRL